MKDSASSDAQIMRERTQRIQQVLEDCVRRLDSGEAVSDDEVIASNSNLMPDLKTALGKLAIVRRARLRARADSDPSQPKRASSAAHEKTQRWAVNSSAAPTVLSGGAPTAPDTRGASNRFAELDAAAPHSPDRASTDRGLPELEGYYIVDLIGRGGMGVVYDAYQQATGRRVAVKYLIDADAQDEASLRRFEREVEVIARLSHPNIVTVLDSGVHQGRYFYAMEHVDGKPLDRAIHPGHGDIAETLKVIATVCDAVDYAHQRGVLHRDLKPSNVLLDERGTPHLLDFGLAKPFDTQTSRLSDSLSQQGQIIGTLGYMSPEQSRGEMDQMSVRSDVYSLGVMAYELLSGQLPCDVKGPLRDVLTRISEKDPIRPSALRRDLGPDLDAILLKALDKSPPRRFATAGDLAADIRRFLNDEPITARKTGAGARALRWVRRNRALAGVGGMAIAALITIAIGLPVTLAQRVMAAEKIARGNAKIASLAQDMITREDNDPSKGVDPALREQLLQWEQEIGEYADVPQTQAGLHHVLGRYALKIGDYPKAQEHLEAALALRRKTLGPRHAETAETLHYLGNAMQKRTLFAEAETHHRAALDIRQAIAGKSDNEKLADSLAALAWVLKDERKLAEAESLYRAALAMRLHLLGAMHHRTAESQNDLGQLLRVTGQHAESEDMLRAALGTRVELFGGRHRLVADSKANLGSFLSDQGRYDEAEPLLREATALRKSLLGDHPDTAVSLNQLGLYLRERGRYVEAEQVLRDAMRVRRLVHEAGHGFIAVSEQTLGQVLLDLGQYDEARQLFESALSVWLPRRDENRNDIANTWDQLAHLFRETGAFDEAERLAGDALQMRRAMYGEESDHVQIGYSLMTIGCIQLDRGDANAALPVLGESLRIVAQKRGATHWRTARVQTALGATLTALGRYEEAEKLLRDAHTTLSAVQGAEAKFTVQAVQRLVALYTAAGNTERAAQYAALLPVGNDNP